VLGRARRRRARFACTRRSCARSRRRPRAGADGRNGAGRERVAVVARVVRPRERVVDDGDDVDFDRGERTVVERAVVECNVVERNVVERNVVGRNVVECAEVDVDGTGGCGERGQRRRPAHGILAA
jgi:hypothetical protein